MQHADRKTLGALRRNLSTCLARAPHVNDAAERRSHQLSAGFEEAAKITRLRRVDRDAGIRKVERVAFAYDETTIASRSKPFRQLSAGLAAIVEQQPHGWTGGALRCDELGLPVDSVEPVRQTPPQESRCRCFAHLEALERDDQVSVCIEGLNVPAGRPRPHGMAPP